MMGLLIAIILIIFLIIYQRPRDIQKLYSAEIQKGAEVQMIEIEANLQISRRLFTENKVSGSVMIQGTAYQVSNDFYTKLISVNQITEKFKQRPYRLTEIYYDKDSNQVLRPMSIDISRDLTTINGTLITKDHTDPMYFKSTDVD